MLMLNVEGGLTLAQLDPDALPGDAYCPEQAAGKWGDTRIEVVKLRCEVGEVKLTSVQIQSDKAEGALVYSAVYANIDALHEAHVDIEQQTSGSSALNLGGADEPVEIGDARRLLAGWRQYVELRAWNQHLGDWLGGSAGVVRCLRHAWQQEPRAYDGGRAASGRLDDLAAREGALPEVLMTNVALACITGWRVGWREWLIDSLWEVHLVAPLSAVPKSTEDDTRTIVCRSRSYQLLPVDQEMWAHEARQPRAYLTPAASQLQ